MREWFDSLAPRERIVVAVGAVAVGVMLFWGLVLAPLGSSVDKLGERVDDKRELIVWMEQAAARIKRAGPSAGGTDAEGDGSLVVLVDRSARSAGLGNALTRNQPVGEDGIRVQLREAPFAAMARWLTQLKTTNGLALDSASIERGSTAGTVNASLVLRQPG
jgi:general secretion pathway protein M